jgi:hypothetical protein
MICGFPSPLPALVGCAAAIAAFCYGAAQEPPPATTRALQESEPQRPPTSHQLLMRDKLVYSNKGLEGLSMADYGKIAEAGNMLGVIARAAVMQSNPTEQYLQMNKNFQEQARDLERHAKEKNLDAASMDYMRITLTCVQCHNYIRERRIK